MQDHTPHALASARNLRRAMSLPERLLWQHLRQRPLGVKFRKQHPLGTFIVDFYCAQNRLVVEIDGISHDMGDHPTRDTHRDEWLKSQGYQVCRIAAHDVLHGPAAVAEAILALCRTSPPPSALRAATFPSGGGSLGVAC